MPSDCCIICVSITQLWRRAPDFFYSLRERTIIVFIVIVILLLSLSLCLSLYLLSLLIPSVIAIVAAIAIDVAIITAIVIVIIVVSIICITYPLWRESTDHKWMYFTKGQ